MGYKGVEISEGRCTEFTVAINSTKVFLTYITFLKKSLYPVLYC